MKARREEVEDENKDEEEEEKEEEEERAEKNAGAQTPLRAGRSNASPLNPN